MHTALDLMTPALVVSTTTSLHDLARMLLANHADGACVTEDGELVGIVTAMDLVFTQRTLKGPGVFTLFELVLPIGQLRAERELERITATTVGALMTHDVVTIPPDLPLGEVAAKMVDDHITLLPVVHPVDGLIGVVSKTTVVRHVLEHTR